MLRLVSVILLALVLIMAASSAFAYRVVLIPSPEVLPDGVYKLEVSAPFNDNLTKKWLPSYRFDGTIGKGLEIALKGFCPAGNWRASGTLLNLTYQATKETASMPGFGVGVWNLYNSDDPNNPKVSYFVGMYKSINVGMALPIKVVANVGTEQLNGVSGGIIIPFNKKFSAAVEWVPEGKLGNKSLRTPGSDSGFVWALGYNQTKNWRFKYANADGDNAWGVVYTNKWLTK